MRTQNLQLNLDFKQAQKLFAVTSYLNNFLEDLFEDAGLYRQEFLKGLKESKEEAKQKKFRVINSLRDLE